MQKVITMHPREVASIHYFSPSNSASLRAHYSMPQNTVTSSQFSSLFGPYFTQQFQTMPMVHDLGLPNSCFSANEAADEEVGHQLSLAEERRKKRMISNRESARRSRIRKQKHLTQLWSQVVHLRSVNRQLLDELNQVIRERDRVIHENCHLRDQEAELQKKVKNLPVQP